MFPKLNSFMRLLLWRMKLAKPYFFPTSGKFTCFGCALEFTLPAQNFSVPAQKHFFIGNLNLEL